MNALDGAYWLVAALTAPVWSRQARGDWRGRFGHAAALPPPTRARILLHAVSVGEVNALRGLVPMLIDGGAEVVVSVGTDTGIARARDLFERGAGAGAGAGVVGVVGGVGGVGGVVRYPLDFSKSVRRFLDAVKPTAVGLVELELWPNFIRECGRRSIPVAVINGRLSARSFKGYRRVRGLLARTFGSLRTAAVQDEVYAERFVALGVSRERCVVTGSMKWDSARVEDEVAGAEALGAALGIDRARPLVVAGSTGPGEEGMLHEACLKAGRGVQLMCAPRKPERFEEAAAALPGCVRRSQRLGGAGGAGGGTARDGGTPGGGRFLLDTIGELRAAYSLADVVVVGRSFGRLYGSDPIEPIALGKATVIGPRYGDFETIVEALGRAGGIRKAASAESLAADLGQLLGDPEGRRELARRGRECIAANQGATRRHAELLLKLA
ncbi:MAG: 3-deoxy-D-manno-octulosonic acid transferase [Phycisphaerales bacterium]